MSYMFQIHCLYCQTPGQLEDFFKLESYLLDISIKSIVLSEKDPFTEIFLFQIQYLETKHLSTAQTSTKLVILITIMFAVEIVLRIYILPINLLQRLVMGISQQSMLKASVLPSQE